MVRERDGAGGWRAARPWPSDWLVIGDGDTEWYAFLRPDDGGVWEWQHDSLEVARVARSLRSMMTEARKKAGPAPAPAEPVPTSHPTLGQLLWRPDRRKWTGSLKAGPGEEVKLFIEPDRDGAEAFLAVAAEAVPAALAERAVGLRGRPGGRGVGTVRGVPCPPVERAGRGDHGHLPRSDAVVGAHGRAGLGRTASDLSLRLQAPRTAQHPRSGTVHLRRSGRPFRPLLSLAPVTARRGCGRPSGAETSCPGLPSTGPRPDPVPACGGGGHHD